MIYHREREQNQYNDFADKFHQALRNEKDSYIARNYLDKRGFTKKTIETFNIGWCPSRIKIKGRELLSGRIIFPLVDEYGDTVAFHGRIPQNKDDIKTGIPRWWNEIYNKSYFLYGLNLSWQEMLKKDCAFIVEGPCDVISCYQHGITNVAGICSSSFTKEQISKIARFTKRIILLLDGDFAGRTAAKKSEKLISKLRGFKILRIDLVEDLDEYDPDSYLRKFGKKRLILKIKNEIEKNINKKRLI